MGAQIDEGRLRQLFDDMTADQPDAPPNRYQGIQRRARRRRWALGAGSIATVAAIATSGIGLSAISQRATSGSRQVPGWALPWPDHRNGSVPQRVLDQAVIAWRHLASKSGASLPLPAPSQVIWYVGQTIVRGQFVVVVFEVATPVGHYLVEGWTEAKLVMHGRPDRSNAESPWIIHFVSAPQPTAPLAIGLMVPGRNRHNWIVELTGPAIHRLLIQAPRVTAESLAAYPTAGMFVRDMGQLTGRVMVSPQVNQVGGRVWFRNAVPVGLPGSAASQVPQLALPAALTGSFGFVLSEVEGQGGGVPAGVRALFAPARAVVARCYGPEPLVIMINDQRSPFGTIRCDDRQHELSLGSRPRQVFSFFVTTSPLTSFRVVLTGR